MEQSVKDHDMLYMYELPGSTVSCPRWKEATVYCPSLD